MSKVSIRGSASPFCDITAYTYDSSLQLIAKTSFLKAW